MGNKWMEDLAVAPGQDVTEQVIQLWALIAMVQCVTDVQESFSLLCSPTGQYTTRSTYKMLC